MNGMSIYDDLAYKIQNELTIADSNYSYIDNADTLELQRSGSVLQTMNASTTTIKTNFAVDSVSTFTGNTIHNARVGIAVSNPAHPLDVEGNTNLNGNLFIGPGSGNDVYIGSGEIKLRDAGTGHISLFNVGDKFKINDTSASGNLGTVGTNLFTIKSTGGNVGIGTEDPANGLLHIKTAGDAAINFEGMTDTGALGAYYGKVKVYVEGVGIKYIALYDI